MTELALISPPVGLNLFVLQGMREQLAFARGARPSGTIVDLYLGVLPFIAMQLVVLALLMLFPAFALWLPAVAR